MKAKLQWRLTPALSALSAATGTKMLLALAAGALLSFPALAQSAADYCARARDPVRCEARQAALKNCADMNRVKKQACLEASMPPVDCSKAQNPQACETAQKARQVCKGKTGKELKICLRDERPRKKKMSKPRPARAIPKKGHK
ncbi:MAG: hypothetical protein M0Q22_10775 [Sulfuritalea sp.]|nr:hypothetical protein [Sulfuritalea sp.]